MHAALWKLLWFDLRGSFRSLLQLRRSWRKLLLFLFMLVFVGLFIASQVFNGSQGNLSDSGAGGRFGNAMPFWAALYLITTWLTASADRGLVMRPAEIHFIVAGPFPNRDIITLNLVRLAYRAAISAIVLALLGMAFMRSFPSALIGLWLLISVSLLVGMLVSLSSRRIHAPIVHRLRRIGTVSAVAIMVTMLMQSMQLIRDNNEAVTVPNIAAACFETPIGQYILPPMAWMFAPLTNNEFWPTTA
ncbi:MAG: putative ABC exporter domain-containing protein, partial [Pirellulaceae bacterium]|nr:putative ABC exporter domain-containing protein [Pirellulaceae bacterium]